MRLRIIFAVSGMLAGLGILAAAAPPFALSPADNRTVQAVLARAAEDGLDPAAYPAGDASSVTRFMRDLNSGRPELRDLDADVSLPASDFDATAALTRAAREGNLAAAFQNLAPPYPDYARLRAALAKYRGIAAGGGWPILDSRSPPDMVMKRLAFEDAKARVLRLDEALRRFQARHGLAADGRLGPATLKEINVTADARADIIVANMERWRWLPRQLEPDRIVINVADASLAVFLKGQSVLASRVIVGTPANPTPVLRAEGAGITVNPPWTVPQSIAAKEILPKLKRNPAWLASQDMVLLDGPPGDPQGLHVNWRAIKAGTFPYHIRQAPGPKNPLGQVKLELPNRFDVYLHDTPGKKAFDKDNRDESHGCVRVEQIMPLASYALNADLSAAKKISDLIETGETSYIPLKKKVPVYFLYWTAFADSQDEVEFRPDIYGRDKRMIAALRRPVHIVQAAPGCGRG